MDGLARVHPFTPMTSRNYFSFLWSTSCSSTLSECTTTSEECQRNAFVLETNGFPSRRKTRRPDPQVHEIQGPHEPHRLLNGALSLQNVDFQPAEMIWGSLQQCVPRHFCFSCTWIINSCEQEEQKRNGSTSRNYCCCYRC